MSTAKVYEKKPFRSACGEWNLYEGLVRPDSRSKRLEELFSQLEKKAGDIFKKIRDVCEAPPRPGDRDPYVYLSNEEVATLRKFIFLSEHRNKWRKELFGNPRRINNHIIGPFIDKRMLHDDWATAELCWLGRLRYFLETSHEELIKAGSLANEDVDLNRDLQTYKHYDDKWDLHIWRAATGKEFLISDTMVGFEGDSEMLLGWSKERPEMVVYERETRNHVYLPIDPDHLLVLCQPYLCRDSAFASILSKLDRSYPGRSLLAKTPHCKARKIFVSPDSKRKGEKSPVERNCFVIPQIGARFHSVVNAYSLSHANEYVIYRSSALLDDSLKDLEVLGNEKKVKWAAQGTRYEGGPLFEDRNEPYPLPRHVQSLLNEDGSSSKIQLMAVHLAFSRAPIPELEGKTTIEVLGFEKALERFVEAHPPKPENHRRANGMSGRQFLELLRPAPFVQMVGLVKLKLQVVMVGKWKSMESLPSMDHLSGEHKFAVVQFFDLMEESFAVEIIRRLWDERQDVLSTFFALVFADRVENEPPPAQWIRYHFGPS